MQIKLLNPAIKLKPATSGSAGIDLVANIPSTIVIPSHSQKKVPTGISVAIPEGWVGLFIFCSSTGIGGLYLANTMGVIDSDYRGEVMAICCNRISDPIHINPMDRFCQLVVVPHYSYEYIEYVDELSSTERGSNGFGSTGS
jgi:dUTP pyrophosphatase